VSRKPSTKRRATRRRRSISLWATGLLLTGAALAVAWWLGLRPELRPAPEPEPPAPVRPVLTGPAMQDSLQAALAAMGLESRQIRKRTLADRGHRWEWAVDLPAGWNLVRTNATITDVVGRWGGRLGSVEEYTSMRTGGRSLRMELGNDSTCLGWLLLEGPREASRGTRAEPRVAIVIDDFGYSLDPVVQAFIDFPKPITLSILPGTPHGAEIHRRALQGGRDVILHLPMEPHGFPREDPGPDAILIGMDPGEIVETFDRGLGFVPGVPGFSNHMGSAATEDPFLMRVLLEEAAARGLFFFDSLTSPRSVGARVAAECGVPCVTNDLFIDNDPEDLGSIMEMIGRLGRQARARGWAVGIGHPHESTLRALRTKLPELEAEGIRLVPVSDLATIRIARR